MVAPGSPWSWTVPSLWDLSNCWGVSFESRLVNFTRFFWVFQTKPSHHVYSIAINLCRRVKLISRMPFPIPKTLSRFDLLKTECIHDGHKLLWFKAGCQTSAGLRKCIAKELASIRNVCSLFLKAVRADTDTHVTASLTPFDVEWWKTTKSDASLFLSCTAGMFLHKWCRCYP